MFLDPEVEDWIRRLPDETYDRVEAAVDMLPELRVGTCRVPFAFDPTRAAVLLVAGDKRGRWTQWYRHAVPTADDRYDAWLTQHGEDR